MPRSPRPSSKAISTVVEDPGDPTLPVILEFQMPSTAITTAPVPRSARGIVWIVGSMLIAVLLALGTLLAIIVLDRAPSAAGALIAVLAIVGAVAASFGDGASLGFVAETERQVEGHLDEHLRRLPDGDSASRAVVDAMRIDEIAHADSARAAGAAPLPSLVTGLMRGTAKLMTRTAYWI